MKKFLPILAASAALLASPAFAQSTNEQNADAQAEAQQITNVTAIATQPGSSTIEYRGGFDTTASVGSPVITGGANQCAGGTGAGIGTTGFGINFALGGETKGCTRRADAAALNALGYHFAAVARMCQEEANADAWFAEHGTICPGVPVKKHKRYKLADGSTAPMAVIAKRPAAGE